MPLTNSPAPIADLLRAKARILAVTHMNPDGDAIGSLVAFGHIAKNLSKDVRLYCVTPIAEHLAWLPLPAPLARSLAELGDWRPELVVVLDCADEKRAGEEMEALLTGAKAGTLVNAPATACIDHHTGNPLFAHANWVDPAQAATGSMVALLAKQFDLPLSGGLGEALYLALVSDTGSFSYGNTGPLALQLAADIVAAGLSVADFTTKYENNWSIARLHLWGQLMAEVALHCDGAIVASVVTQEHLDRFSAKPTDLENFASWLRRIQGVKVVLFARVSSKGSKVSLRSMGDVNVRDVAALFGGGGHVAAAGIEFTVTPREAAAMVLAELKKVLEP